MAVGRTRYRFGLFEADPQNGRLLRQGEPVRLQDQPFQVLVALLERHGEIVTRDELRDRLWPRDTFVSFDKSLGVALTKVRAALGDDAGNPRFVETVPKRGYRFIAPVAVDSSSLQATVVPVSAPV
jgi:DNA-binding winged helix-turn-helix (wHTH) protein